MTLSTHASLVSNFRRNSSLTFFRSLPTSGFQLRKSVETWVRFSRNQEETRAIRRIAAAVAGSDTPFNVPIRRVYIFNWSLKFTLVTPVVATIEAISCANKLHWIKLYDGAWMKFIVWTPSLPLVTSIFIAVSTILLVTVRKKVLSKALYLFEWIYFFHAATIVFRLHVIFINEMCWLQLVEKKISKNVCCLF